MGENVLKFGTYVRVGNAAEAYELLQKNRNNKIVGGGIWMRLGSRRVATAIDLSACGLDQIEETETEFRIGAMCTLRQLERHAGLNALVNNVFEFAVHDIVGVQLRNTATVGGSIYGRFGFSDVLSAFLALDSYVELTGAGRVPRFLCFFILFYFLFLQYSRVSAAVSSGRQHIRNVHGERAAVRVFACACMLARKRDFYLSTFPVKDEAEENLHINRAGRDDCRLAGGNGRTAEMLRFHPRNVQRLAAMRDGHAQVIQWGHGGIRRVICQQDDTQTAVIVAGRSDFHQLQTENHAINRNRLRAFRIDAVGDFLIDGIAQRDQLIRRRSAQAFTERHGREQQRHKQG